jgi:DNA-binding response OmpR family regulator
MQKKRILYIDDEVELLELAANFFEEEGLPIETCSDFNGALELIRNNDYDLIISDAKMPSGCGLELFSIIKKEAHFQGKIILVTGNLENMKDCQEMGYNQIIFKPIAFGELVARVKEVLSPSVPEQSDNDQSPSLVEECWRSLHVAKVRE